MRDGLCIYPMNFHGIGFWNFSMPHESSVLIYYYYFILHMYVFWNIIEICGLNHFSARSDFLRNRYIEPVFATHCAISRVEPKTKPSPPLNSTHLSHVRFSWGSTWHMRQLDSVWFFACMHVSHMPTADSGCSHA